MQQRDLYEHSARPLFGRTYCNGDVVLNNIFPSFLLLLHNAFATTTCFMYKKASFVLTRKKRKISYLTVPEKPQKQSPFTNWNKALILIFVASKVLSHTHLYTSASYYRVCSTYLGDRTRVYYIELLNVVIV